MGRDKRNEGQSEHFTKMTRRLMETDAWRALPPVAQALYPWLKLEWHGPKANNNGKIRLSVRQASERLGVDPKTAMRGFQELQAKGFTAVTEGARLGVGGEAKSHSLELTELPLSGTEGRKLYLAWKAGHDFPIKKAAVNNPFGAVGKNKTPIQKTEQTVVKFGTKKRLPFPKTE